MSLDRDEASRLIDLAAFRSGSMDGIITREMPRVLWYLSRADMFGGSVTVAEVAEMLAEKGEAEDLDDASTKAERSLQTLWTLGLAETMWQNGPWRWTGSRNARYERSNGEGF